MNKYEKTTEAKMKKELITVKKNEWGAACNCLFCAKDKEVINVSINGINRDLITRLCRNHLTLLYQKIGEYLKNTPKKEIINKIIFTVDNLKYAEEKRERQ